MLSSCYIAVIAFCTLSIAFANASSNISTVVTLTSAVAGSALAIYPLIRHTVKTPHSKKSIAKKFKSQPIDITEWNRLFNDDGRLIHCSKNEIKNLKSEIFFRGLSPKVRPIAYKYLLGIYPWTTASSERAVIDEENTIKYKDLESYWKLAIYSNTQGWIPPEAKPRVNEFYKNLALDVPRQNYLENGESFKNDAEFVNHKRSLLEHSVMALFALEPTIDEYLQPMSWWAFPFAMIYDKKADAFWTFAQSWKEVATSSQVGTNFELNYRNRLQILASLVEFMDPELHSKIMGLDSNHYVFMLPFFYLYKFRTFDLDTTCRLWEMLWTRHLSPHFIYFIALAAVESSRSALLQANDTDDLMIVFQTKIEKLPLRQLLPDATFLFYKFKKKFEKRFRGKVHLESCFDDNKRVEFLIDPPKFYASTFAFSFGKASDNKMALWKLFCKV